MQIRGYTIQTIQTDIPFKSIHTRRGNLANKDMHLVSLKRAEKHILPLFVVPM